jgi:hypothetical protein
LFQTLSVIAALASAPFAMAQTQTHLIDFFPELPVQGQQVTLSFDPRLVNAALHGAMIVQTRLFVTFTTIGDFDAAELAIQLSPTVADPPEGVSLLVTGADLGWAGQGTFTAMLTSDALDSTLPDGGRAVWFFDLYRFDADPASFSGSFSDDSRIEIDFVSAVAPCAADFNADGFVNPDDLSDYITCFFLDVQFPASCPAADFNADGFRNPDDLTDFITAFFVGC